jgi:hypothetical protein
MERLLEPAGYKDRPFEALAAEASKTAAATAKTTAKTTAAIRRSTSVLRWTLAAAAVFAIASGGIFVGVRSRGALPAIARSSGAPAMDWSALPRASAAFDVQRLSGEPRIAQRRVSAGGRLGLGEWLETDGSSRARIAIADIGQVEVDENTRVRLVNTGEKEHRLDLERGVIKARVDAPPRLFVVSTPAAAAVDLGCEYTLEVDEAGSGVLHVTSGWVSLDSLAGDRSSLVPAGASCRTRKGAGPGTPYFGDASAKLVDALAKLDFEGGGALALRTVLAEARARDSLTLWHLLSRVEEPSRREVYARLRSLSPPPKSVKEPDVIRLDRPALDRWKNDLTVTW